MVKTEMAKSSAHFEAERVKHISARDDAVAELGRLQQTQPDAAIAGAGPLQENRQKQAAATLDRDVADARAQDAERLRDKAAADEVEAIKHGN